MYRTKTDTRIRSKIIRDVQLAQSIKNLAMHNSKPRTAKAIYKSSLHEPIKKCEISSLTSTVNGSVLRKLDSSSLATFKFENLNKELQIWAPLFHQFVATVVNDSVVGTAVTSAIALKFQNTHMSAFQHIISQILDHGGATDETISILNKMGISISTSSANNMKNNLLERQKQHTDKLMMEEKKELENPTGRSIQSAEIIGDNIDITRRPSHMSKDKKRLSWHWFLLVGVEKRVLNPFLDDSAPLADINEVDSSQFVPSLLECSSMEERFIFHIMKVLVKYLDCFKKYCDCLPKCLPHPHMTETSNKSDYAIRDLLDKSENKSEDMISILEHIHANYVSHTNDESPSVIQKKVFGGDVLTNERAYSAQLAMLNSPTDYERLAGVIHRPEGLHRMMNLLLVFKSSEFKQLV